MIAIMRGYRARDASPANQRKMAMSKEAIAELKAAGARLTWSIRAEIREADIQPFSQSRADAQRSSTLHWLRALEAQLLRRPHTFGEN